MRIERLDETTRKNLLEDLLKRSPNSYGTYEASVREILDEVKNRRDEAVFAYTEKFDGAALNADNIQVTEEEIQKAYSQVDSSLLNVIRKSLKNIESYHAKQMQYSWFDSKPDGTILGQKVTPLQRVGVYVPGGKAVYPSSVLMNIVPAKVAGVDEIIMVTPPEKTVKSIRQRWLRQRKRVWMQSIKWAVHRQSQHLLMEPRASRKWIRLWDRAISM